MPFFGCDSLQALSGLQESLQILCPEPKPLNKLLAFVCSQTERHSRKFSLKEIVIIPSDL